MKLNLEKALKILKDKGWHLQKEENLGDKRGQPRYIEKSSIDGKPWVYTQREVIKWARVYTSDNNQNTKFKEPLKEFDHIKNRRATKKAIKEENFDSIPQNDKVKEENPYNWD